MIDLVWGGGAVFTWALVRFFHVCTPGNGNKLLCARVYVSMVLFVEEEQVGEFVRVVELCHQCLMPTLRSADRNVAGTPALLLSSHSTF